MPPLPPTFDIRLTDKKQLTPGVCELTFTREDGATFDFEAGQWVSLILPLAEGELRRSYSIASAPREDASFELAVTRVEGGPGSTYLHELPIGEKLRAIGPQGFFTRPLHKAGPSIFVATGTGVTPLRSMIHAAAAAESTLPMWLLFGVRSEEDLLYKAEFEELARKHPHIRFEPTLSRADESWTGRRGYVQTHLPEFWAELSALGIGAPHAYVCGLQKMVGAVRDLLRKQMGIPREQVHAERYD